MLTAIRYERQRSVPGERRCGAAALGMVLRSFGIEAEQDDIWDRVKTSAGTKYRTLTFALAKEARRRSVAAVLGRLRDPWPFLEQCSREAAEVPNADFRFVLNHRVRPDSPLGHFSVLVDCRTEDNAVVLHDPQFGPNRTLTAAELRELWTPAGEACEITGCVGILFWRPEHTEQPDRELTCPRCTVRFPLPLRLDEPLPWSVIFCPDCGKVVLR